MGRRLGIGRIGGLAILFAIAATTAGTPGCAGDTGTLSTSAPGAATSCMKCHNASLGGDYSGPGIENPHPFPGADNIQCTTCHGGDPSGDTALASHVPPPPEIGDEENLENDREAYFNRLTLTGLDKYDDYTVGGQTYTALDYIQFLNPGDLRVVTQARGCGQCHQGHAECVAGSLLATEAGVLSGALYAIGADNAVPASQNLHEDTAADLAFRAITDPDYPAGSPAVGPVSELLEHPLFSERGANGPLDIHDNPLYDAPGLSDDRLADNRVVTGSPLANLYHEQVAFTCGDCHLGSAGANNRSGDYRSSGCTACHMPYSLGGRSQSSDPNVDKFEPLDPDDIDAPERAHPRTHRIASTHKTLPNGQTVQGIDDYACAGCHQGSNRTVMQYWGIRLDQNEDLRRGRQYPAQPASYVDTTGDTRLFDPAVGNKEFNGRDRRQYIRFEDYDGDGRDDTPADVHYEAGMGCIDCHGSYDLHGGDVNTPGRDLMSRMEQAVAIRCESCHGGVDAYAQTVTGTAHDGSTAEVAVDARGNVLDHVVKEADGHFYLTSRLTGERHFVPQTLDTIVDSQKTHPETGQPLFSAKASYAMGRADGNAATGIGPQQTGGVTPGFSHADNMDCASCHASWTNTCMGCHLEGEYNTGFNFSNITGDRIVFREKNADFVYQSPVFFQLGVDSSNKITQTSPNTKMFFQWEDRNNTDSDIFTFSDRNGNGSDPATPFPSLSHNAMMAHSIRGRVTAENEGPRYCVACHLTDEGVTNYSAQYDAFRTALATNDFASLDFPLLRNHIGLNPGNQMNSPLWVHMVAGLGSGLFLFDEDGCPENPLDNDNNRAGCNGTAPAADYDPADAFFNLDRVVDGTGQSTASSNHPLMMGPPAPNLRDGAANPNLSGPLGATLTQMLTDPTTGWVLDSWFDADGEPGGDASSFLPGP